MVFLPFTTRKIYGYCKNYSVSGNSIRTCKRTKALAALPDAAFLSALENIPAIKTGRPASAK